MASITGLLGVEPTTVFEFGDPWPSKRRADRVRSHGAWIYEEPRTVADDEDPHGMESLVRLAERFEPVSDELRVLAERFDVRVLMLGFSDSDQGGFFVGPETMRRLGSLHAAFVPTVYLAPEIFEGDLAGYRPA